MRSLPMTRTLAAFIIATFASLVVLNLFEMRPSWLCLIYPLGWIGAYHLLGPFRARRTSALPDRYTRILVVVTLVILTLPRIPYVLNWLPNNSMVVIADDYARTAQLVDRDSYKALAHDPSVTVYVPDDLDRNTEYKYNAEKPIQPVDISQMQEWEREILRLPREGFFW